MNPEVSPCPICRSEADYRPEEGMDKSLAWCTNGKCSDLVNEEVCYTINQWNARYEQAKASWNKYYDDELMRMSETRGPEGSHCCNNAYCLIYNCKEESHWK